MILQQSLKNKIKGNRDFPNDPVVKNLLFNAEDSGSIPVWGNNIPRAMGQVSSPYTPQLLSLHTWEPTYNIKRET